MSKLKITQFRVKPGTKVSLDRWPTRVDALYQTKSEYRQLLQKRVDELAEMQRMFFAADSYALLLIFQAMDAAGKDGAIRHVMSGVNPQGCQVFSFKKPGPAALDHDFLWRTSRSLPERGRIGIFNRSYYEEVLVVRIHPELLVRQKLPEDIVSDEDLWKHRFESICDHEKHLHRNGMRIIKFYLHLSKEEQRQRFLARIDEPEKNWKFDERDIIERGHWDEYMRAYEECLTETGTKQCPWYVVPADDKKNARLIVSQIILDRMRDLDIAYPETSDERRAALLHIREQLVAEGKT